MRPEELAALFHTLYPGAEIESIARFGIDDAQPEGEGTEKGIGYGEPVRVRGHRGQEVIDVVVHTASADMFGHDRRADRAAEMLLAFDTFPAIPRQARAVDVGAITVDHRFRSLRDCGEFYLVTEYRAGLPYADDLRAIAHRKQLSDIDRTRADGLADYLATLHREPTGTDVEYRRAIRDLVGSGEGIFGIADGYPDESPTTLLEQVRRIEMAAAPWRWKLRDSRRSRRTHGDFHPFNILFDQDGHLAVLDAARGCVGDPADDVCCLAVNYVFFAAADPESWALAFRELWQRFWSRYFDGGGDPSVLDAAPPFWAWRLLVVANPRWYPALAEDTRRGLLDLAERVLAAGRLDLDAPEVLF